MLGSILILSAFILFGLIFGSFIGMASYRLIREENFFSYSRCPDCRHSLGVFDLVPLLSYLMCGRKCRYCSSRISPRYFVIELLTAALFALIYYQLGLSFKSILVCGLAVCLIIISITDIEDYIIPDSVQVVMAIIGIVYAFWQRYPLTQVILLPLGCYVIGIILQRSFRWLMKQDGLGTGDIKFFAVAGIFLKVEMLASFFFISGLAGIFTAIVWRILEKGERFPFAPSLAASLYLCLLFPGISGLTSFMQ